MAACSGAHAQNAAHKGASRDVSLSVRVLNHVNSAANALNRTMDSVREAVVYLGRDHIRSLVTLLLMARVEQKPAALMVIALVRAKLCELMTDTMENGDPGAFFTVGLFSVLDALMDLPMDEVVKNLPISEELVAALVDREGTMGEALELAISIEQGNIDAAATEDS
ncbi:MAG: HDOD domain-containing protein, partial [Pseudomonadota bacterium]